MVSILISAILGALVLARPVLAQVYTYAPYSLIVQPMIQSSPDEPSDCVLTNATLVTGTSGPHARVLYCRGHPAYGESTDNEGVFGIHGIVPAGVTKFDITVDVYSSTALSSPQLCAVVSNTVIADSTFTDSGVLQGVRYESVADDTIHGASFTLGPVSVAGPNRRVSLTQTNIPLKMVTSSGTLMNCIGATCDEQYFRMEVYIQGCQRLCFFNSNAFACCAGATCTDAGKVSVLGVTLNFHN